MGSAPIDPYAAVTYGSYATSRIQACAAAMDPVYAAALRDLAERLARTTEAMSAALKRAGEAAVRAGPRPGEADPSLRAREVLERLSHYAGSRADGKALAGRILGGQSLSSALRRRGTALMAVLDQATAAVTDERARLPEYAAWLAEIAAARADLEAAMRPSRPPGARSAGAVPDVAAAHAEWLKVYGAAKLVVQGALRLHGARIPTMEIFPDLGE